MKNLKENILVTLISIVLIGVIVVSLSIPLYLTFYKDDSSSKKETQVEEVKQEESTTVDSNTIDAGSLEVNGENENGVEIDTNNITVDGSSQ